MNGTKATLYLLLLSIFSFAGCGGATLVIAKPDAVERGLVGEILGRIEAKGLRIVAAELRTIDADTAARHYAACIFLFANSNEI